MPLKWADMKTEIISIAIVMTAVALLFWAMQVSARVEVTYKSCTDSGGRWDFATDKCHYERGKP